MGRYLSVRSWLLACLLALSPILSMAQATPLIVGVLPTLSPRVLLNSYQPFRTYLEQTLKRPVELVTATDFATFHKSTMAGDYDLVVTAAHLGRLAQTEGGYIPLATFKATNRAMLVTARATPLKSIQDLRGHAVAALDRFALVTSQTLVWLEAQGLREGTDFRLLETSSHNSSAYSVLSGESVLAIISPAGWGQMPANIRDSLQVFASLPAIPGLMLLANPRLAREVPRLKSALLAFSPDLPEGKQFFEATRYQGIREIAPEEMKSLDPYTRYLRQHLEH
ncbi:phosphate/phosphite/phosphonate ABC transporter substrate-binding protein [Sulfuriferula sp.]|uniref:phosphate/phosphite/phosphonate ABC transporter substrate-binding protein n=1 Tax=Sulfuriferula sp. TaxID=2025307 RepID=UPI0027303B4C|nr:phosphate/phosphite/phosphonate ABC transporter substrate-binding protein [Sulfuriferula sp.]MDP2027182.1 phosphate/phosphite/phosphonate ABC transporter substrate-binding protein [Sulfuriferula sp.]